MELKDVIVSIIVTAIICLGFGFGFGVKHQVAQEKKLNKEYTPMFTTKITVEDQKGLTAKVVAYTIPRCDPKDANDDGWWYTKYMADTTTSIMIETIEWPFKDECIE